MPESDIHVPVFRIMLYVLYIFSTFTFNQSMSFYLFYIYHMKYICIYVYVTSVGVAYYTIENHCSFHYCFNSLKVKWSVFFTIRLLSAKHLKRFFNISITTYKSYLLQWPENIVCIVVFYCDVFCWVCPVFLKAFKYMETVIPALVKSNVFQLSSTFPIF